MNLTPSRGPLQLPDSLQAQMLDFRRRVWTVKLTEAAAASLGGVLAAFLVTFTLDRLLDTPTAVRVALFVAALLACALIPCALQHWVWGHRQLAQLARLLRRRHPGVGDQLLGIIELAENEAEQARSRRLCEAAIRQVADVAEQRDFRDAVPHPRHLRNACLAGAALLGTLVALAISPAAASNAWARLLMPWRATPRYTFTALQPLPDALIVPHGEPFTVAVSLAESSARRPGVGRAQLGGQPPVSALLRDGAYQFELPGQIEAGTLALSIGDVERRLPIQPMLRPELTNLTATVTLPEYLGRPGAQQKDVRGGALSLVRGSRASFTATVNRELKSAHVDGVATPPQGAAVASPVYDVFASRDVEFQWRDRFDLSGREPFRLAVAAREDEPPSLTCEDLPRQRVLLDVETLAFTVRAHDDFGVRRVGLEWRGLETTAARQPAEGERILAAGGQTAEALEAAGTFSAAMLGIAPQPIRVRLFVEDYFPGRERVYSSDHVFHVLNAEQHALWITEQLSKWHRQALEVRDRELQLFETNKALRALSPEELDQPETRKRIDAQAAGERANSRRLSNLVRSGDDLIKQAMRNPDFGVGHLEKWAEMLQILKDIAGNRMPSVADLLKQASQAPPSASPAGGKPATPSVKVGNVRTSGSGQPKPPAKSDDQPPPQPVPSLVDVESSQLSPKPADKDDAPPQPSNPSSPRLGLPQTRLKGNGGSSGKPQPPAAAKLDEAIAQQQDLLAEFEKIAEELNRILANLEGSTLVKRLKAASRQQTDVANRLSDQIADAFGLNGAVPRDPVGKLLQELSIEEAKGSQNVSNIMDDMQAYYERRRFQQFKAVLDEMRTLDVIGSLRELGDDLQKDSGVSIAQAEFWSDTLDRWAEDLVDAGCCGQCPGCKSRGSLPPSIVLEVLQILEGEVNLREETRVAEQARPAVSAEEHAAQGQTLSATQQALRDRLDKVVVRIRELPEGEELFAKEIRLLTVVARVMQEAAELLARPETGAPAIAAETEVIELLLQSKRFNPKGGGGGGSTPGGGGGGDTQDSALALVGSGVNDKEVREDRGVAQATGRAENKLPEEFRAGLDEYFNRLEKPARP